MMSVETEIRQAMTRRQLLGRTTTGIRTVALAWLLNGEAFGAPASPPKGGTSPQAGSHGALQKHQTTWHKAR